MLSWLTCCTFLEASAFVCLSWSCSCFSKPRVSSTISLSLASLASFLLADSSAVRSQVSAVSLLMRAASSSCRQDGILAGNNGLVRKLLELCLKSDLEGLCCLLCNCKCGAPSTLCRPAQLKK